VRAPQQGVLQQNRRKAAIPDPRQVAESGRPRISLRRRRADQCGSPLTSFENSSFEFVFGKGLFGILWPD
jgi:hypothetical protein